MPSIAVPSPVRALGTAFQVSATKPALVIYGAILTATNPLLIGSSTAELFLETADIQNATTWTTVGYLRNQASVALSVSIAITDSDAVQVSAMIPAGKWVRLRSAIAGTAQVALGSQQETIFQ